MPTYNLAFLGFGNVGQALARLLLRKRADLQEKHHIAFRITGIATGRHGMAVDPGGLDVARALRALESRAAQPLQDLGEQPPPQDAFDFIRRSAADVLFENTPVNYASGQPAVDHLSLALELGMHAITANKGPVVHAYRQLTGMAERKGKKFYFESAVMDGAPVFSLFREALPVARLQAFSGVLNSTTNLVLTRMEAGESMEQAVAYAQAIGIAETDPSGDIDGWDAAVKVAALVTVLMDLPLLPDQVDRQGIRSLTLGDITRARELGCRWKLVCSARRDGDEVRAWVAPEMVPAGSPLYQVEGTTSVVQFETDVLGNLTLIESDPGPHTTAYGLLADFINAVKD